MSSNSVKSKPSKLEFFVEILTVLGKDQLTIEGIQRRLTIDNCDSSKTLYSALAFLESKNCIALKRNQATCLYRNTVKGERVSRFFNLIDASVTQSLLISR